MHEYETLLHYVRNKVNSLPNFAEYLEHTTLFAPMTQTLQQKKIPLKSFYLHLENEKTAFVPKPPISGEPNKECLQEQPLPQELQPFKPLITLAVTLLQKAVVSLDELNLGLQELSLQHMSPSYLLQHFLKQRKITSEQFLAYLQASPEPTTEKNIYKVHLNTNHLTFSLDLHSQSRSIGIYKVIRELGRGGMGVVYEVYHPALNQFRALKCLIPEENGSETLCQRFLREVQTTAKLKHPHLVQIFDSGLWEGKPYFAMELIEGTSLEDLIQKGLPIRKGIEYITQCLEGLSYAHTQKILHRDLKPSNVLITPYGLAKITDFGLAKDLTLSETDKKLTRTGAILGTPGYMAPEQILGKNDAIRECTDIYAITVCLYQILTHQIPFQGNTIDQLFSQILYQDPVPPSKINPKVHPNLDWVVLKGLEKDPKKRYESAQQFATDLKLFLAGHSLLYAKPTHFVEQAKKWSYAHKWLVSSVFLLLVLFIFTGLFFRGSQRRLELQLFTQIYHPIEMRLSQLQENLRETPSWHLKILFEVLADLNSALTVDPQSLLARTKKQEVSRRLIQLACSSKDYPLAYYVAKDLSRFSLVSEHEVNLLFQEIEAEEIQAKQAEKIRFNFLSKRFQEKLVSEIEQKDAIFELSQMRSAWVHEQLLSSVQEGCDYFLFSSLNAPEKKQWYKTVIESVGRSQRSEFAPILIKGLRTFLLKLGTLPYSERSREQESFMVLLGKALGNLKQPEHSKTLQSIRDQMGPRSLFFLQTENANKKLLKQLDQKSVEHFDEERKGFIYHDRGQYQEAINAFSLAIQKNPKASLYSNRGLTKKISGDLEGALQDVTQAISIRPSDHELYLNRVAIYQQMGDLKNAFLDVESAIKMNPNFADAYLFRGILWHKEKAYEKAIQDFSKCLELNPNSAEAYNSRSVVRADIGELLGALEDANQAILLDSQNEKFYNSRGYAKERLFDIDGALADYHQSTVINPRYAIAYYNRGNMRAEKRDLHGALQDLQMAMELDPKESDYHIAVADIYVSQKKFTEAVALSEQAMALNPENYRVYRFQGNLWSEQGQYKKAIDAFNQAIQRHPEDDVSYNNRGRAKLNLQDLAGAEEDYLKAIALSPKVAIYYANLGGVRERQEQWESALECYNRAIELDSFYETSYLGKACAYFHMSQFDKAIQYLDIFLKKQPHSVKGQILKADIYGQLKKFGEALKIYEGISSEELITSGLEEDFYNNQGVTKRFLKDFEGAIADFQILIQKYPEYAKAYINVAITLYQQSKYEEALEFCEIGLQKSPDLAFAWGTKGMILEALKREKEAFDFYEEVLSRQIHPFLLEQYIDFFLKQIRKIYQNKQYPFLLEKLYAFKKIVPASHPKWSQVDSWIQQIEKEILKKEK